MESRKKRMLINSLIYVLYAVVLVFFLFPLFWVLSTSLKTVPELFQTPIVWFSSDPQFENYAYIFERTQILTYLMNSFIIVASTIIISLIVAVPAAYALSRFKFKFKKAFMLFILIFQMVSPVVVAIPLYRLFVQFNLINMHWSLILVYVAIQLPFTTWFLKGFFDTIPQALDEAAKIDGCSRLQMIWKVLIPVSTPGIASASILVGVLSWSQFVIPFILLDDSALYPVSVGLINLQSTAEAITTHYLAAASMIAILPVIILFVALQKYIVGALTSGAVKE
ncbi:carbohydrate ABC transporter permease [Alkalicoccus saliphilus]|uniref:Carbohydrate ABC transporter permease n=1 Tax=Alkalicoccus saliphilus TaxID=200989 RepID=A0A2T4U6S9_9BACI|nr:carbohydrate ABC transporter permease [Alkalicoccus saliphilus]PTL39108.1 carbohydrate ABC transporter permease [Alkalicoccus saliphilus]